MSAEGRGASLGLAGILLGAVAVRIAFLGSTPLSWEEAEIAQASAVVMPCLKQLSFLEALWRQWHVFAVNVNPLRNLFPVNLPLLWSLGETELAYRLQAAVSGSLICWLGYLWVRRHADRRTALCAAALLAFNPFLIAFNRFALPDSLQVMLILLGMVALDRDPARRRGRGRAICAVCFGLAVLIKTNAIILTALLLWASHRYAALRLRDAAVIVAGAVATVLVLFADQLNVLLPTLFGDLGLRSRVTALISSPAPWGRLLDDGRFYARAYLWYFEQTLAPLAVALAVRRRVTSPLFHLALWCALAYFVVLVVQGRTFFRYLQAGVVLAALALAFVFGGLLASPRRSRWALVALVGYLTWGVGAHATYALAQHHHIPYGYLRNRAFTLAGEGRILLYGRNAETEYYLSPTHNLWLDATGNPCEPGVIRNEEYPAWADRVRKIPASVQALLDPLTARRGDIVVVTGIQMAGGEPAPLGVSLRVGGRRLWGVRRYGHVLRPVEEFLALYERDASLQAAYRLLERIPLTNGSSSVAALLLQKT